jgi:glyoxylase-like metal-dependent hydrolase (beta-lactamase superfamily II)
MGAYERREFGAVTVLAATGGGAYPYGNSLVVRGSEGVLVVDPSLAVHDGGARLAADAVLLSHAHEDHLAGLALVDAPVHVHEADLAAVRSVDRLLAGYGLPPTAAADFRRALVTDFHVVDRPDATGFSDGSRFDLGDRTVTAVHLPGHTAGHSGLLVEPDGFLYVADIDLTSFGPFYGDVGSSLDDFEASMRRCGAIDARWFGTFHQKGVIEGAAEFRRRLQRYADVVAARDAALIAFAAEPRSVEEIARHRLIYRPHVDAPYVPSVERRSAEQHVARLVRAGAVVEVEPGRFRAADD